MGFIIKYCDVCGARIPADDIARGIAVEQSNRTYCKDHRPEGVTQSPDSTKPRPGTRKRPGTSQRLKAAGSRATHTSPSGRHVKMESGRSTPTPLGNSSSNKPMPLAMVVGALVVIGLAVSMIVMGMGGKDSGKSHATNNATNHNTPPPPPIVVNNNGGVANNQAVLSPLERWQQKLRQMETRFDKFENRAGGTDNADAVAEATNWLKETLALSDELSRIGGATEDDSQLLDRLLDSWTDVVALPCYREADRRSRTWIDAGQLAEAEQYLARCVAGLSPDFPASYCRQNSRPFRMLRDRLDAVRKQIADQVPLAASETVVGLGTHNARLHAGSPTIESGQFASFFRFSPGAGKLVGIRAKSGAFDPHLIVVSPDARQQQCNDALTSNDAVLEFETVEGDYKIVVCAEAAGATGDFTLEIREFTLADAMAVTDVRPGEFTFDAQPTPWSAVLRLKLSPTEDIRSLEISMTADGADLDLYVRPDMPFFGWGYNSQFESRGQTSSEGMYSTGARADGQLLARTFYIMVFNCRPEATKVSMVVRLNGPRPPDQVAFDALATPGVPLAISLPVPGGRGYRLVAIDVPENTAELRVWLDGPANNVGMLMRFGAPPATMAEAGWTGAPALDSGFLQMAVQQPQAGRYYAVVLVTDGRPLDAKLHVELK